MVIASQLRSGTAIKYQGVNYKVMAAEYHPGQGQMGGSTHTRLQNLDTHTLWEHSFRADLKLEEIALQRRSLEFLYPAADQSCFMDPLSYDQIGIPNDMMGDQSRFLETGMKLTVEFLEGQPVGVIFPGVIEARIADTAPPLHQQQDTNFKTARLDNGVEVLVPQFVKTGDVIRLDLTTLKYMDRAKSKHV